MVPLPAVGGAIAGAVVVSGPLGVGRLDEGARAWLAALGRAAGAVLLDGKTVVRDGHSAGVDNSESEIITLTARRQKNNTHV